MTPKNKKTGQKKKYSSSAKKDRGIFELVYDATKERTQFVALNGEEIITVDQVVESTEPVYPFPATDDLIKHRVVLLPSKPIEYGTEKELVDEIHRFIHKYVEVSPFFERVAPFYVLLTWVYDSFKELPYLRAIGDAGSGKSRFLKTVGSLCYKPMFTVGATTTAAIFRIINQFKGTLILDEADLRFSDTNVEIVKILNNGFQAGIPVLRCGDSETNFGVQAFVVYGPKIIATRRKFDDKALESRFLVEYMDGRLTRDDVPINTDESFEEEALAIRNKCLLWRLRNYGKKVIDSSYQDKTIEPRLNQIVSPLVSVITDPSLKEELMRFIREYNQELIVERGLSFEALILDSIIYLVNLSSGGDITMQAIAERCNIALVRGERELSGRKVGSIVRQAFRINTVKKNIGFVVDIVSYKQQIKRLSQKYGVLSEQVNDVNVPQSDETFTKEIEDLMAGGHPISFR